MNHFPDKLIFEDGGMVGASRIFILCGRFRYISALGIIECPAGMRTDGTSIPRAFWSIFSPFGEFFKAALPHDWGYSSLNNRFTRLEIDNIFKEAMFNAGVPWYQREMVYRAVRAFGGKVYNGLRK